MKKLLIFLLALAFTIGMAYSACLRVISPSGGTWYKGSTHNITWTGVPTTADVKINIFKSSVDPANFVEQLTSTADGTEPWNIGMGYTNGTYVIRVKYADNSCLADSSPFTVTDAPPESITVNNPHSGTPPWCIGSTKTITWSSSGIAAGTNMKINIFKNSISPANFIEQLTTTNTGSKSWTISNSYATGTYYIRIKTADNSTSGDSDSFSINSCPNPGSSCSPFMVFKPQRNGFGLIGHKLEIRWGNMMPLMKKKNINSASNRIDSIGEAGLFNKLKMVRIEIKNVKCPAQTPIATEEVRSKYVMKKKPSKSIAELAKKPVVVNFFQWKTIKSSIPDNGYYSWIIPKTFKKGCYIIRVTRLWCDSNDNDRIATSQVFRLSQLVPYDPTDVWRNIHH